jgi:hypothetical protein
MKPEFILDPEQVRQFARQPHEPIAFPDATSKRAYKNEIWAKYLEFEKYLARAGYTSNLGRPADDDFDFYLNQDVGIFRQISFEMTNRRMIGVELLQQIADFLQGLEDEYSVFISNEFDDADLELFMIVVTRTKVYGAFETSRMAKRFGFDPAIGSIGPLSPAGEGLNDDVL